MGTSNTIKSALIAIFLIAILTASTKALAFAVGDGTAGNPYQISTREHLEAVNNDLSANYILINDIDLTGIDFDRAVIAYSTSTGILFEGTAFTGTFNGNGFDIKNLTINGGGNNNIGLFGRIFFGGAVSNLGIVDCNISGNYHIGALCGDNTYGTISSSYTTGKVSGENHLVGGICGINYGTISSSYAASEVSGSNLLVGGLCGRNYGTISSSYATGMVSGYSYIGGLCGENHGTISSSYAIGMVSGNSYLGGLCGYNFKGTLTSTYATGEVLGSGYYIGGLCGYNYRGKIINCYSKGKVTGSYDMGGLVGKIDTGEDYEDRDNFWDTQTSEFETSDTGIGKTSAEMQDINTFLSVGWDFRDVWALSNEISEFLGYPVFRWQIPTEQLTFEVTFNLDGKGARIGGGELIQTIAYGIAATAPEVSGNADWGFTGWDKAFDSVKSHLVITALYKYNNWVGDGTAGNPYQISTRADLEAVNNDLSAHYILINDIDLSGTTYTRAVIAPYYDSSSLRFTGTFDGDGYQIKNLTFSDNINYYIGLFGRIYYGAIVNNAALIDCNIVGNHIVGGFCGQNFGTIISSYTTGSVTGNDNVGGLCGSNSGTIQTSYSKCAVSGNYAGGLCGNNSGTIKYSYSTGAVSGDFYFGGLCGSNYYGTINSSFWDTQTSGQTTSAGGEGKTTAEMQNINTFLYAGWGFDYIWIMSEVQSEFGGYPILFWQITFSVTFDLDEKGVRVDGGELEQTVACFRSATAPIVAANLGYRWIGWDTDFNNITDNLIITALYEELSENGSPEAPYKIATQHHLEEINNNIEANYILINDIDLSGTIYSESPISVFNGTFNGNGYQIKNLTISGNNNDYYTGLFGQIGSQASISNLGIVDCEITGRLYIGSLCGYNTGTITSSYATGAVLGTDSVGIFTGLNAGEIIDCFAAGEVNGSSFVGAITGENAGLVQNSYTMASVSSQWLAGGITGANWGVIESSYSTSAVNAPSMAGGVCGLNTNLISNSFWDTQSSGLNESSGGIGKTTAEMQDINTFLTAGWDFVNEDVNGQMYIWYMPEGDYPRLYWQADKGDINYDGQLDISDLRVLAFEWLSLPQENLRVVSDINFDGVVDLLDLMVLADQWHLE